MQKSAIHLGDGAYASFNEYGELLITANHHDPKYASDVVVINASATARLAELIKEVKDAY